MDIINNSSMYSSTKQSSTFESEAASDDHLSEETESGWTAYFEDPGEDYTYASASSLISDAASKLPNNNPLPDPLSGAGDDLKIPRKLSFRQKALQFPIDTSLEDTASSPDNSPKVVADLGPFCQRKTSGYISSSLGKGRIMAENYTENERNLQLSFEMKSSGYTDLKKRGLCLVPLSMFANFMG